jgi:hypothetical protein
MSCIFGFWLVPYVIGSRLSASYPHCNFLMYSLFGVSPRLGSSSFVQSWRVDLQPIRSHRVNKKDLISSCIVSFNILVVRTLLSLGSKGLRKTAKILRWPVFFFFFWVWTSISWVHILIYRMHGSREAPSQGHVSIKKKRETEDNPRPGWGTRLVMKRHHDCWSILVNLLWNIYVAQQIQIIFCQFKDLVVDFNSSVSDYDRSAWDDSGNAFGTGIVIVKYFCPELRPRRKEAGLKEDFFHVASQQLSLVNYGSHLWWILRWREGTD